MGCGSMVHEPCFTLENCLNTLDADVLAHCVTMSSSASIYTVQDRWVVVFFNTLRQRVNGRPFADGIFKCIFLHENESIFPRISLRFVPKVRINNIPALVQIMAWCRPGDKPLSEPMIILYWRIYASLGLNELRDELKNLVDLNFEIRYDIFYTIQQVY